jgi:hypothetical protein
MSANAQPCRIRSSHPLRSLNYKQGDVIHLIYSRHPSEIIEYKNAIFKKCQVRGSVDSVIFSFNNVQYVLPLHQIGVMGVDIDKF